jgi:hypothetical protein
MSNGSEACCALGICCPPASAEQTEALATIIDHNNKSKGPLTPHDAALVVLENFDLAPKGLLQPMLMEAVRLSKHAKK